MLCYHEYFMITLYYYYFIIIIMYYVMYFNQPTTKAQYIIIITVHSHNTLYNQVLHWLKCSVMWWQYGLYAYRGPYIDKFNFWTRFLQLKCTIVIVVSLDLETVEVCMCCHLLYCYSMHIKIYINCLLVWFVWSFSSIFIIFYWLIQVDKTDSKRHVPIIVLVLLTFYRICDILMFSCLGPIFMV